MRRGDIYVADLDPARPGEADKRRPVLVVSNDGANGAVELHGRGVVTVVPLASSVQRVLPFQVLMKRKDTGLRADSKAQVEQVRALAFGRIGRRVGQVPPALMAEVDDALRLHLGL
jgi:mRNA interferase MazF